MAPVAICAGGGGGGSGRLCVARTVEYGKGAKFCKGFGEVCVIHCCSLVCDIVAYRSTRVHQLMKWRELKFQPLPTNVLLSRERNELSLNSDESFGR